MIAVIAAKVTAVIPAKVIVVIPAKAGIQVESSMPCKTVEPGTSFTFETGHMLYTRIFGRMMLLVRLRASNTPSGN